MNYFIMNEKFTIKFNFLIKNQYKVPQKRKNYLKTSSSIIKYSEIGSKIIKFV